MRPFYPRNKFRNKKCELDGRSFSSQLERDVFGQLLIMGFRPDQIQGQDHVYLTKARVLYIPDFKVTNNAGVSFWVEAKGFETPEWRIKLKLWRFYGPGSLIVYKRRGKSDVYLAETISVPEVFDE